VAIQGITVFVTSVLASFFSRRVCHFADDTSFASAGAQFAARIKRSLCIWFVICCICIAYMYVGVLLVFAAELLSN